MIGIREGFTAAVRRVLGDRPRAAAAGIPLHLGGHGGDPFPTPRLTVHWHPPACAAQEARPGRREGKTLSLLGRLGVRGKSAWRRYVKERKAAGRPG